MIILSNPDSLDKVVNQLNTTHVEEYEKRKSAINSNYTAAQSYKITDD